MRRLSLLFFASLGLASAVWAGPRLPDVVDHALGMRNRDAAAAQLEASASDASPEDAPWVLLYAGELRRLAGDTDAARKHFAEVLDKYPKSAAKDPALLAVAVIDAGGNPGGNILATLGLIGDKGVPDTLNADRYLLLAQDGAAHGAPRDQVAAWSKKAKEYAGSDRESAKRVNAALDSLPSEPAPAKDTDLTAILAIRAAVASGRYDKIPALAEPFSSRFADSPFAKEATYALRRAEKGTKIDPARVAVLLPLTGSYALPAASLRAAIELANSKADSALKLDFVDTGGTPEKCVAALEAATIDRGAAIVMGPLLKEEALVCAPAAQAIHVPLLTFTSSEEVLAAGDQVFRAFPSTEQQVEALLTETYDVRGLHKYAIIHPTTPFGENAARIFTDAVTARGGSVTERASYSTDQKDFRATAKVLGKKDYKARAGEFSRLQQEAKRNGGDPSKVVLPPVIDYEAIFIPDSYQRVALLASALAFEEFPVGRFRPHRDDQPLVLLGLNAWNNDELARRGGNYVLDCIFVDAFDPRAPGVSGFVDAWKAHGTGDATVVEAVAYDTTRLVAAAVRSGGDPITALLAQKLSDPVAGTQGFGTDRQVARTWRLLTVTKEGIKPLSPYEPPPPAPPEGSAGK